MILKMSFKHIFSQQATFLFNNNVKVLVAELSELAKDLQAKI